MSSPAIDTDRPASDETTSIRSEPVSLPRVVTSEFIKFRSLRSSWAVLGGAVLGMLVVALIVGYNTRHLTKNLQPDDVVASSPLQGYYLGQLLIGALGVLFVSGEFSTGMIASTMAAVPKRLPVLWAKLLVFTSIVLVSMTTASVIAFLLGEGVIGHFRASYGLGDPTALRVALGTGVYLTLVGVIGGALGWIVRSTPGALVAYFATVLVVPVLFNSVLGTWGKDVGKYLPSTAGASFVSSLREPQTLTPWVGLAVLGVWAVVAVAVAAAQLRRRDA
ncbi:ABC transporter permease [Allobranchiibius huperziae]|uniref:ABC-type transport system involved in multi-copper enzyme maturation permease subunit n=1 Tax=Allobranchiibius huperziae TaxID=1874116 RepID=A0A853DBE5_9MICO|nr:ABC transporter permease [Allobranchiibius huperziae]NYJ73273.1 ABC-type transport system involved in multi-copper enzyme maturation permease subunit [Allobranchiibius huperziae]